MSRFKVIRRGVLHFEGNELYMDGWELHGGGSAFSISQRHRESRAAVLIEIASLVGVYLEEKECDVIGLGHRGAIEVEREARAEVDRIRAASRPALPAPHRPWWRFWR